MKRTGLTWIRIIGVALACGAVTAAQHTAVSPETLMGQARHLEEVEGNLDAAIAIYKKVVADPKASRATVATALLRLGTVYEKLGKQEARQAFERIVRDYPDQANLATQARRRLAAIAFQSSTGEREFVARRIWSGPDLAEHLAATPTTGFGAKPSSDGRWLAFVDWASKGNVAIRNVTTGEIRLVTRDAGRASKIGARDYGTAFHPVMSPDGSQVAYEWSSGGKYSLRVIPVGGGRPRVLVDDVNYTTAIAWAPDGKRLATITHGNLHIAVVSLATQTSTRLKSFPWRPRYAGAPPDLGGFSPDGRFLVYSIPDEFAPSNGGIFVIATDSGQETALVQGSSKNLSPTWTPDGRAVVFVSDRSTDYGLWSIRVENGKAAGQPELLRAHIGPIQGLGFSRDGTYFYGSMSRQANVHVVGLDASTPTITSAPTFLTDRFLGSNRAARWSPDGRFLAFLRWTPSGEQIVIRSADGAERALPTTLRDGGPVSAGPRWFPDSRSLLVTEVDRDTRRSTFKQVQIDTGAEAVVLQGPNWDMRRLTGPSSDGKSVYYTKAPQFLSPNDSHTIRLMRRDLDTGKETELYRSVLGPNYGTAYFDPAISPDGSRVAFVALNAANRRTLMTVATSGGEPVREVAHGNHLPGPVDPDSTALWTKDGRFILVACYEDDGQRIRRVWAFSSEGDESRQLDLTMAELKLTDLSADGRRLALSSTTTTPEVFMVKNLLSRPAVK